MFVKSNILLTRPQADSMRTAQKLQAMGLGTVIVPMLNIITNFDIAEKINLVARNADVQGIIITSSNAIKSLLAINFPKYITVYCVGGYSSKQAEDNGFENVINAGSNVKELTQYIKKEVIPTNGLLLYASGSEISYDLVTDLNNLGYTIKREVVYLSQNLEFIPPMLKENICGQKITHALFYSKKTAQIFKELIMANDLAMYMNNITAVTLSENINLAIEDLPWHNIYSANFPNEDSLIAVLTQTIDV